MVTVDHRLLCEHTFALVDRNRFPQPLWPAGLRVEPLVASKLRASADLLPGLVSLAALPDSTRTACLELLAEQAEAREPLLFSALLKASAPAERVALHFKATLLAKAPAFELYLRQFDPRLFVQYDWLLAAAQRRCLFGPITAWTVCLDGEWRTFTPPEAPMVGGLRLDAQQAAQIEALQGINKALATLPPEGISVRQARTQEAYGLLARARRHGLTRERCLAHFLAHGWTVHPQFDQHPEVALRLQRMSPEDDFPYLAVMSDLDAPALTRIREDLAQGALP